MSASRIVICDDEAPLRRMLCEHLSECGFDVDQAANAAELADVLNAGKPDLIILDVRMPGKDGLVHISQISDERVEHVSDKLAEGDVVKVKVLEVDRQGRIRLSMKAVSEDEAATA